MFVNEYINEADRQSYNLDWVCSQRNQTLYRDRFCRPHAWTIDREKNAFLAIIWSHREEEFQGFAFYWKERWAFFDMKIVEHVNDRERNTIWTKFLIKDLNFAEKGEPETIEEMLRDLKEAINYQDAVTSSVSQRFSTIEFAAKGLK